LFPISGKDINIIVHRLYPGQGKIPRIVEMMLLGVSCCWPTSRLSAQCQSR